MKPTLSDIAKICSTYSLGKCLGEIEQVPGGLLHHLWYLQTNQGEYAVKCIENKNLKLLQHNLLSSEKTQEVAALMQHNHIPTVVALKQNDRYILELKNKTFVVMPWITGAPLEAQHVTNLMTVLIGNLLAKIHRVKISGDFLKPNWNGYSKRGWQKLLRPYFKLDIVDRLDRELDNLTKWSVEAKLANKILNKELIFSHRDFDLKNVLWQRPEKNYQPILLDWEYAGLINPMLDLLIVALNWSEVHQGKINLEKFKSVVNGFCEISKTPQLLSEVIFAGYWGYCLDWLSYNVEKLASHPRAATEISQTLDVMHLVQECEAELLSILTSRS